MKRILCRLIPLFCIALLSCGRVPRDIIVTYDLSKGIPQIIDNDWINLDKIAQISKFRSGAGHDYSDDFERNRSMKHYFNWKNTCTDIFYFVSRRDT